MDKKRIDDYEPGPVPTPKPLDRFGFVKQELNNSSEALAKSRSACEFERCVSFQLNLCQDFLLLELV